MPICVYGNCHNVVEEAAERVRVTITWGAGKKHEKEAAAFCCKRHAGYWLLEQADKLREPQP